MNKGVVIREIKDILGSYNIFGEIQKFNLIP